MHRFTYVAVVMAACGGAREDDKPTVYTHDDPKFVLDVPAGYIAKARLGDGTVEFETSRSAYSLSVSWKEATGSPADELAAWKQTHDADRAAEPEHVLGEGELPGGGRWLATDRLTSSVWSWLRVGNQMIECLSSGGGMSRVPETLINACKTLRPAP